MTIPGKIVQIGRYAIETLSFNTIVVGTGAAGFNAADHLYNYGQTDIAMVTEHINSGTSRNTGSDKQTYYKLTLSGAEPDSVREMAETLFNGQCVDGEHALIEAALSAPSFLKLAGLGVPFPTNRYGEYIGYKTDHDPRQRATSVGPLTSKQMTEALERSVKAKNIPIFDKCQVIAILTDDGRATGVLCLNLTEPEDESARFRIFSARNIVYATGGPAGMYADSAYPLGHCGGSGIAFQAGIIGKNLTEWQYGLASVKPRWNVSGTYMQALPRFMSTDQNGNDPHEFLGDFFTNHGELLSKVFLKGYEWPFDVRKVSSGSSIIDILVYIECRLKNRRVFLDFRTNPFDLLVDFQSISPESRLYLEKAGATFGTPYERLMHMNQPAVEFYRSRGVDLANEPLEIALCAQHNNGGLGIDLWWQTNIEGFFAVGEVAASHGVYRPGGSALNAGQVGAMRAAQYISQNRQGAAPELNADCISQIEQTIALSETVLYGSMKPDTRESVATMADPKLDFANTVDQMWLTAQARMSHVGAAIRSVDLINAVTAEVENELKNFTNIIKASAPKQLTVLYRLYDILICQQVYLNAMIDYIEHGGKSRGSAIYYDVHGIRPFDRLPEVFRFKLDDGSRSCQVQETTFENYRCRFNWRPVRPIPSDDDFFENVWRQYRENKNIY